jgi:hypothetical protein
MTARTASPRRGGLNIFIVTAKRQITLSKELLVHLGVQPGEKIAATKLPDGRIEMKSARAPGNIADAFGFLKRESAPSLSMEEMSELTKRGWAGDR